MDELDLISQILETLGSAAAVFVVMYLWFRDTKKDLEAERTRTEKLQAEMNAMRDSQIVQQAAQIQVLEELQRTLTNRALGHSQNSGGGSLN